MALAEPSDTSSDGVLLLRSGRVLAGKIRRDGQRYFVTLPLGEIRIRADEVEHACPTLADGYQYKRSALVPGSAGPHLDLAAWCIINGLWNEAQRELDEARRLEPRHPKIPLLERRLDTDRRSAATPKPPAEEIADTSPRRTGADDPPVTGVSKEVMETFTAVVQPILQNHCSAAACHGPSTTSSFRLVRLPYGRLASQRLTHQNLRAALAAVDREAPDKSPLLTMPLKPHGTAKEAIFKTRDLARYRQLVAWVRQVMGGPSDVASKAEQDRQPPLLQATTELEAEAEPRKTPHESLKVLKPAGFRSPPRGSEEGATESSHMAPSPLHQEGPSNQDRDGLPSQGSRLGGFVPRDPFDPEIFNRRHFPGRAAPKRPM
jgi:hypothetical protein